MSGKFWSRFWWMDWLIIAGVALHMGSIFATNYVIASLPLAIEQAVMLEQNPAARELLDMQFWFLATSATIVGAWIGLYVWFRVKLMGRSRVCEMFIYVSAFAIFFISMRDFVNDVSILLKLVLVG